MKYVYSTLRVICYAKDFTVDQLREAVEYLRTQPQTPFTGLQARVSTTAGSYRLFAQPILPLDEILGRHLPRCGLRLTLGWIDGSETWKRGQVGPAFKEGGRTLIVSSLHGPLLAGKC